LTIKYRTALVGITNTSIPRVVSSEEAKIYAKKYNFSYYEVNSFDEHETDTFVNSFVKVVANHIEISDLRDPYITLLNIKQVYNKII